MVEYFPGTVVYRSHYLRKLIPRGNVYKYAGKYSGSYPGECSKYDYYAGRWRDEVPELDNVGILPEVSTPIKDKGKMIVDAQVEEDDSGSTTDEEMATESDPEPDVVGSEELDGDSEEGEDPD